MDEFKLKFLRKKYMGKKVDITTDRGRVVGVLNYIGPNVVLGWEMQVTVDRLPFRFQKLISIKVYEEPIKIINDKPKEEVK